MVMFTDFIVVNSFKGMMGCFEVVILSGLMTLDYLLISAILYSVTSLRSCRKAKHDILHYLRFDISSELILSSLSLFSFSLRELIIF